MAGRAELERLGQSIMGASVQAQFLGLNGVVDYLDLAFADVVRLASAELEAEEDGAVERERWLMEGDVDGG